MILSLWCALSLSLSFFLPPGFWPRHVHVLVCINSTSGCLPLSLSHVPLCLSLSLSLFLPRPPWTLEPSVSMHKLKYLYSDMEISPCWHWPVPVSLYVYIYMYIYICHFKSCCLCGVPVLLCTCYVSWSISIIYVASDCSIHALSSLDLI